MMEKNTLNLSLMRLLAVEEELIDIGAKDQFSKLLALSSESAEGIGRVLCSIIDEMPSLPVYAGTLLKAVNSSESTSALISKAIHEDPSLAALILKNVNSSYYAFPNRIVDLQHAITLLGTKQIHLLVLYHGMRNVLPNTRSFVNLQSQSVLLSHLTSAVAELLDPPKVPFFSILGLLGLMGKGVIFLAQHKDPVIKEAAPLLNHFKIGSMLLIRWNLPEIIHETIRLMGKARYSPLGEIPEPFRQGVSILTVAHAVLEQKSTVASDGPEYLQEYVSYAGFGTETIDSLAEDRILPLLRKKKRVLPQVVRNFLDTCPRKNIQLKTFGIGAHEMRALERRTLQEEEHQQLQPDFPSPLDLSTTPPTPPPAPHPTGGRFVYAPFQKLKAFCGRILCTFKGNG
jgi:HD-like signal output (HDOD) protein